MANVTLRKKVLANNKSSLFLDYFLLLLIKNWKRIQKRVLGLKVFDKPRDETEKAHNKSTLAFADLIQPKDSRKLEIKIWL
jgi:hypothetical protein